MMNSLFSKNTSKGAEERRDGGTEGRREEGKRFSIQSHHVICPSLETGFEEKGTPIQGWAGGWGGGGGAGAGGGRDGGGRRRRSSTLSAIMSFDEGLLASPWGRCRWACRRWAWRRTSAPDTWGRWSAAPVTAATAWQICHNTGRKMRREDQDSSIHLTGRGRDGEMILRKN